MALASKVHLNAGPPGLPQTVCIFQKHDFLAKVPESNLVCGIYSVSTDGSSMLSPMLPASAPQLPLPLYSAAAFNNCIPFLARIFAVYCRTFLEPGFPCGTECHPFLYIARSSKPSTNSKIMEHPQLSSAIS